MTDRPRYPVVPDRAPDHERAPQNGEGLESEVAPESSVESRGSEEPERRSDPTTGSATTGSATAGSTTTRSDPTTRSAAQGAATANSATPSNAPTPTPTPTTAPAPRPPQLPNAAPAPRPEHLGHTTLVVEEGVFRSRLRRPRDLLGAVVALTVGMLVVVLAVTAQQTAIAIDDDLIDAQNSLPDVLWGLLSALAGLGTVMLPLAASVSLLVRRRGRQLLESVAALTVGAIVLTWISTTVRDYGSETLYTSLTGTAPADGLAYPTSPLLGGLVAFITVARLMSRPRWGPLSVLIVGSAAVVGAVSAGSTAAAQGLSIAVGLAIGLLGRYVLGTPTTRPSGADVAATLLSAHIPLVMLRARGGSQSGRTYMAVTAEGVQLDVVVLDRDLEGSGLAEALWRSIRLRATAESSAGLSMRNEVDRAAMMAYAAEVAGVPAPRLQLAAMVSADSALLAYERYEGRTVSPGSRAKTDRPTDEELDIAWHAVGLLQQRFMAHQQLHSGNIVYNGPGTHLKGLASGAVAAGDVVLRLDVAELLVTQSLQTDVPTAVASARRVIGDEAVLRALPVLQAVALSGPTRAALRERKELLKELRAQLLAINPTIDVQPIDLVRLKPRTVVTLILGTIAGYVLLSQLAQVNLTDILAEADWRWAGAALALSFTTYVGATLGLTGFVPDRLHFFRTLQAQFAASFATLVSPPTLGAVAVNARYLNRSGLPAAAAAATVGVAQVAAFIVHVSLMLIVAIAAGTQSDLQFNPPRGVIIGVGVVAMLVGGLASISHVRRWLANRIRPMVEQVIPRLVTVAQRPAKLVEGFGGILLLNVAYCACLVASVRAFSDDLTIAAICFVYLAGSTLGQAAPTPGGLGVVEAAIAAGLTAAGLDSALAVSATLLFRTVTFWLPTVPGWFSFRNLTANGLL